ncbi:MAG: hypothetical protein EOP86_24765 [Verrucomicrobiaceae bacterium]|nr:MAG: hypothetical protein EOP86_24765 [Verrucomicrobiaceae bacterium]
MMGPIPAAAARGRPWAPHDTLLLPHGCPAKDHLVYGMVYKPLVTPLIATARAAGAKVIKDLPMLLWQGAVH